MLLSPVKCYKLNIIAVYCMILFLFSSISNALVLRKLHLKKKKKNPFEVFMITLTAFNLIGTLIELPFVITSNLFCR